MACLGSEGKGGAGSAGRRAILPGLAVRRGLPLVGLACAGGFYCKLGSSAGLDLQGLGLGGYTQNIQPHGFGVNRITGIVLDSAAVVVAAVACLGSEGKGGAGSARRRAILPGLAVGRGLPLVAKSDARCFHGILGGSTGLHLLGLGLRGDLRHNRVDREGQFLRAAVVADQLDDYRVCTRLRSATGIGYGVIRVFFKLCSLGIFYDYRRGFYLAIICVDCVGKFNR